MSLLGYDILGPVRRRPVLPTAESGTLSAGTLAGSLRHTSQGQFITLDIPPSRSQIIISRSAGRQFSQTGLCSFATFPIFGDEF